MPVAVAEAASLGTITAKSLVVVGNSSTVSTPTILGCDNFTGTTGATMAARAATVAAPCSNRVWTAHVGTWTIQTNQAASTATVDAVATENTATTNSTARVVLSSLNTGGRSGGLVLSHNGTSNYLAAVMIDATPDRIELRLYNAGAATLLTTLNPTFATTNTLEMSRSSALITVTLNGTSVGSYSLSSAQLTALGAGSRAGLYGGNASVRFDDFAVTSP
ncbi:MAG: hypothetical protein ACXVKP_19020 [Ilumatobacteraceae bacterium]